MNTTRLKKVVLSNIPLVIISLILGYSFWYVASYDQTIMLQLNIPLCFSDTTDYILQAPEKINITLKGKRADMYALDQQSLAAHINVNKFLPGKHGILLTEQHLFLPKNITLVHYQPSNLSITVCESSNT